MDARNRLTAFDEFQIGETYFWKKGTRYRGPIVCSGKLTASRTILMKENGVIYHYSSPTWPNRFIQVGLAMQELSMFPDLERPSIAVLEKRLTQYRDELRMSKKKPPVQACGNCDFFDTSLLMCWNTQNMLGDTCAHVSYNSWCPYWKRSTG